MAHATLSPSSADRWVTCPGSVRLSEGRPDDSSPYADEGTAAHEVAARCLTANVDAATLVGATTENGVGVTSDMAAHVQTYVDFVRALVASVGHSLKFVETPLPIGDITGEVGAQGTADVVILAATELIVVDLKFGRGVVVEARDNPQLQLYALGALQEFGLLGDFRTVRMVIHQPRLGAVSEWVQTVEELEHFASRVETAAAATRAPDAPLTPGEKACRFCKAKATCPALRAEVEAMLEHSPLGPATDTEVLATAMAKVDLVEGWVKAVRAEANSRLLAGLPVPGFKLVQGKRGARAWADPGQAEQMLKSFRLKVEEMYDLSLISPTSAEKLAKAGALGPRQWAKAQALIAQPEGRPSVAPDSDKRPALVMSSVASDFDDMTQPDRLAA